jgi:hypothetical protein
VGTVRILYGAGTISLQTAVHPKYALGALNMKEEEVSCLLRASIVVIINKCFET